MGSSNMSKIESVRQFKQGKSVEAYLDILFRSLGFQIRPTTRDEERALYLGDRLFTQGSRQFFVEYKSGIQTQRTGNIFIETISVDDPHHYKPGWAFTCKADYIIYATIFNGCLLVFRPDDLRNVMDTLKAKFKEVPTSNHQNYGYNTHGLLIPLEWAKKNL